MLSLCSRLPDLLDSPPLLLPCFSCFLCTVSTSDPAIFLLHAFTHLLFTDGDQEFGSCLEGSQDAYRWNELWLLDHIQLYCTSPFDIPYFPQLILFVAFSVTIVPRQNLVKCCAVEFGALDRRFDFLGPALLSDNLYSMYQAQEEKKKNISRHKNRIMKPQTTSCKNLRRIMF
jgi:hypothetical protein